jgi:hypothetical protein
MERWKKSMQMSVDTCKRLVEKENFSANLRNQEQDKIMAELFIVLLNFIICFMNMVNSKYQTNL